MCSALDQVGPPTFDGLTNVKRWQLVFLQTWTDKMNILVMLLSSCGPYDLNGREEWGEWAGYIATYESVCS